MARNFIKSNIEYVDFGDPIALHISGSDSNVGGTGITGAIWGYIISSVGFNQLLMIITSAGSAQDFGLMNINGILRGQSSSGDTAGGSITAGVWTHFAFTIASAAGGVGTATVYKNGAVDATGTGQSVFNVGGQVLAVRAGSDGVNSGREFDGYLADMAIWNVDLTAGEIKALSRGARPGRIRPGNLKFWSELRGDRSPEPDFSGYGAFGRMKGTSKIAGPPLESLFTPDFPQAFIAAATPSVVFTAVGRNIFKLQRPGWRW